MDTSFWFSGSVTPMVFENPELPGQECEWPSRDVSKCVQGFMETPETIILHCCVMIVYWTFLYFMPDDCRCSGHFPILVVSMCVMNYQETGSTCRQCRRRKSKSKHRSKSRYEWQPLGPFLNRDPPGAQDQILAFGRGNYSPICPGSSPLTRGQVVSVVESIYNIFRATASPDFVRQICPASLSSRYNGPLVIWTCRKPNRRQV
jgi:hypothetical protein